MNNGLIATRYATALLEFANQSNFQEQVYLEAKAVIKSFFDFVTLRKTIDNPLLSSSEKKKLILNAAGGKVSKPFEKFVNLLMEKNREVHLQLIMLKYVDLYRKQKNIHSGRLITATSIDVSIENRLLKMIEVETGGKVEIEKIIDKDIIGGFMLEVDFVRWDASISGQLKRIKSDYIENTNRTKEI